MTKKVKLVKQLMTGIRSFLRKWHNTVIPLTDYISRLISSWSWFGRWSLVEYVPCVWLLELLIIDQRLRPILTDQCEIHLQSMDQVYSPDRYYYRTTSAWSWNPFKLMINHLKECIHLNIWVLIMNLEASHHRAPKYNHYAVTHTVSLGDMDIVTIACTLSCTNCCGLHKIGQNDIHINIKTPSAFF